MVIMRFNHPTTARFLFENGHVVTCRKGNKLPKYITPVTINNKIGGMRVLLLTISGTEWSMQNFLNPLVPHSGFSSVKEWIDAIRSFGVVERDLIHVYYVHTMENTKNLNKISPLDKMEQMEIV